MGYQREIQLFEHMGVMVSVVKSADCKSVASAM